MWLRCSANLLRQSNLRLGSLPRSLCLDGGVTVDGVHNGLNMIIHKLSKPNARHQRQMPATDNPNTEGEHRASVR